MKSDAQDVETYLNQVSADRKKVLSAVRSLCRKILDGAEERI